MTDAKQEVWVAERTDGTIVTCSRARDVAALAADMVRPIAEVVRYVPASSVPEAPEPAKADKRQILLKEAARLLRNHIAGENADDLMHYWADEWDATQARPEPAKASGWVPAKPSPGDDEPSLLQLYWVQFDDGTVSSVPHRFEAGRWMVDGLTQRATVIAYCPVRPPAPPDSEEK